MGKWPDNGIIYCEKENIWCMSVDTNTGKCKRKHICVLYDPEYLEMRKEQEKIKQTKTMKRMGKIRTGKFKGL